MWDSGIGRRILVKVHRWSLPWRRGVAGRGRPRPAYEQPIRRLPASLREVVFTRLDGGVRAGPGCGRRSGTGHCRGTPVARRCRRQRALVRGRGPATGRLDDLVRFAHRIGGRPGAGPAHRHERAGRSGAAGAAALRRARHLRDPRLRPGALPRPALGKCLRGRCAQRCCAGGGAGGRRVDGRPSGCGDPGGRDRRTRDGGVAAAGCGPLGGRGRSGARRATCWRQRTRPGRRADA